MQHSILVPAAVLVIWTLIVLGWLMATRLQAMTKLGIDLTKSAPGGRGQDLQGIIPDNAMWKAHNYTHLHEQPTLFYAAVAILAISGAGFGFNAQIAWCYVILRIIHSIWQATVNTIMPVRFGLFLLSSLCLLVLAVRALMAVI